MHLVLCFAAALMTFGVAPLSAVADDSETCRDAQKGDEAVAACGRLIARNPKDAAAYNNRGHVYNAKGDYDRAVADFNEAIRLDAKLAVAYNNRGFAWYRKSDYDRAIADYDQVIRLDPKVAVAYNNRGNAWYGKREYDRAIVDYDQAIRLNPKYAVAYNGRGNAYRSKGDHDRAIADYDQALTLDPGNASTRQNRERAQAAKEAALAAAKPAAEVPRASPAVLTDRRVALVIGNSDYRAVPILATPRRDAQAVADALRQDGFQTVMLMSDVTRDAMRDALRAFRAIADNADWAVVYYAGHGLETGGTSHLVPIDASLHDERAAEDETIAHTEVAAAIGGARELRLIILDASRTNPFAAGTSQPSAGSARQGLGTPPGPKPGTLMVYSTKAGEVAGDGDGANGPFAKALAARLRTPGLDVRRLFDAVRDEVLAATGGRQQPFIYGTLAGPKDYFFVAGK
jgi:tetratricopeptide (TPR) repeat protein